MKNGGYTRLQERNAVDARHTVLTVVVVVGVAAILGKACIIAGVAHGGRPGVLCPDVVAGQLPARLIDGDDQIKARHVVFAISGQAASVAGFLYVDSDILGKGYHTKSQEEQ